MEIKSIETGRTYKSAHIVGTNDKDQAKRAVMAWFKETDDRLQGSAVMPVEGGFKVVLYTD